MNCTRQNDKYKAYPATYVPGKPLNAGFLDGPDALGANVVAASLANLDTWFAAFKLSMADCAKSV